MTPEDWDKVEKYCEGKPKLLELAKGMTGRRERKMEELKEGENVLAMYRKRARVVAVWVGENGDRWYEMDTVGVWSQRSVDEGIAKGTITIVREEGGE